MIVKKYVHSCLFVDDSDKTLIVDPGIYSEEALGSVLANISRLDYVLITHEHADHMSVSLIKKIVTKFPKVTIISTPSVQEILSKEGVAVETKGDQFIEIESVPHEKVIGSTPQNVLFHIGNKLTTPGDSHSFNTTREVLALPVQAPWGSMVGAVELALKLKPKKIIPIHDWHWNDEARAGLYNMLESYFKDHNIEFYKPSTNEAIEV